MRGLSKIICKLSPFACNKTITTAQKIKLYEKYYITLHVTKHEYVDIMQLFWKAYTANEPCFMAAGLGRQYNPCFEEMVMENLCQGYSLVSVCKSTGKVVGAAINSVTTVHTKSDYEEKANECPCEATAELIRFYSYIHDAPCLFYKCRTPVVFETSYLMVLPSERDRCIGLNLIQGSRNLCKDLNFSLYRVDCTSAITAKICERLDFQLVWEMPYSSFRRPDGKQLYRPLTPHHSVKVFIDYPKLQCKYCKNRYC